MLKKRIILVLALLFGASYFASQYYFEFQQESTVPTVLKTLYGDFVISEPVVIELLNDKYMQRLKDIRQYGVRYYAIKKEEYNRFEHCVGVFVLLRKFGAPLREQVAGLLHDVSHTVFSHVGDHIFKCVAGEESYQDKIHEKFIEQTSLTKILRKYHMRIKDILPANKSFKALDCELPDICADRLEYNLKGGLVEGLLTEKDISQIVSDTRFENNQWFFTNPESAKKLALVSLHLTEHVWGSAAEMLFSDWISEAINEALDLKIITSEDIHFSTDDVVWNKLLSCNNSLINRAIAKTLNYKDYFKLGTHDNCDYVVKGKFRGINPLIQVDGNLVRLTEVDIEYQKEFLRVKNLMAAGWPIINK